MMGWACQNTLYLFMKIAQGNLMKVTENGQVEREMESANVINVQYMHV
jgi:hypothetical protein